MSIDPAGPEYWHNCKVSGQIRGATFGPCFAYGKYKERE